VGRVRCEKRRNRKFPREPLATSLEYAVYARLYSPRCKPRGRFNPRRFGRAKVCLHSPESISSENEIWESSIVLRLSVSSDRSVRGSWKNSFEFMKFQLMHDESSSSVDGCYFAAQLLSINKLYK